MSACPEPIVPFPIKPPTCMFKRGQESNNKICKLNITVLALFLNSMHLNTLIIALSYNRAHRQKLWNKQVVNGKFVKH